MKPAKSKSKRAKSPRLFLIVASLVVLSAAAASFFYAHGWLLYYGDAEAHLSRARILIDSQTPGYEELGTAWLPLPHVLMLPFVRFDFLWRSGLAGAIPSAICFVIAGAFLFSATRRIFESPAPAVAATALFALNPNLLYLQSIPMTESYFFAALMALLYFSVRFRDTQGWGSVAGAGLATLAGTLTRYDGWVLIPFAAAYFLITAKRYRAAAALIFCLIASLGPAYWMAHNWWMTRDALDFYRGPYSARAIQGNQPCPGRNDWLLAWLYFRTAAGFCAGPVLPLAGLVGLAAWTARPEQLKRALWPFALLAIPSAFYVWSLHSGIVPIFPGTLWPVHSLYNTRYGTAALPFLALAAAGLVALIPQRWRAVSAAILVLAAISPWLLQPRPSNWITWEESRLNSEGRRAWTHEAARYLALNYRPGSGIITSFNDLSGIFREAGIPFREIFTGDNGLAWDATITRPEISLWQEWAVVITGDQVQSCINRAARDGIYYKLEKQIVAKGTKDIIEIYRRQYGPA